MLKNGGIPEIIRFCLGNLTNNLVNICIFIVYVNTSWIRHEFGNLLHYVPCYI